MSTTTLIIARAGTTFGPEEPALYIGGKTDLPLVQEGRVQARQLGAYLAERGLAPAQIFTSELKRGVQTAQEIRKAIGNKVPIQKLVLLNEIDYGPDEKHPEENVLKRLDEAALKSWDEESIPPLGWHVDSIGLRAGWHDFGQRIIRDFPGQVVLAVTHDGVARFASVLTGDANALTASNGVALNPGSFGHFAYEGPNWHCVGWNTPALLTSLSQGMPQKPAIAV